MSYSSQVLADSPMGYWRLGDASGTTMVDSSGNSRNGTYGASGITLGVTGLLVGDADTAATYNGSAESGVTDAAWMDVTQATIEAWFKTTDTGENYIAGRWSGLASSNHMFIDLQASNGIRVYATIAGSTRTASATVTGLRDGNPHHVVATYNGTDLLLYVDKVLKATVTISGSLITTAAQDFKIGARTVVNSSSFLGTLDEIAFYDHALTAARVTAHYDAGTTASQTVNIGLATETDTALAIASIVAGAVKAIGQPTETDTALALTTTAGAVVSIGFASETDTALPVTVVETGSPQTIDMGFASETDTALAITATVGATVTIGLPSETDTALGITTTAAAVVSISIATETDTALTIAVVAPTVVALGIATETDTALPLAAIIITYQTDTHNTVGSLVINGYGVATWTPLVVAPPAALAPIHDYDVAIAFSTPTMDGTRAVYTTTEVMTPRHRDRILVGGKDVTYLRGVPTPTPSFRLIEPLDYGAGSLTLPQINAQFEQPGVGALKWCKKGKPVLVQRVDRETNEVVATDYRGFITDYDIDGSSLVCALGGQIAGRMALRWHPMPVFKKTVDAGVIIADRVRESLPGSFRPLLGPNTGIELHTFGGMNSLDHFNELMAKTVKIDGSQRTVTRGDDGVWRAPLKDRTTVDFTMYLDGSRLPAVLHQSIAEEPNRIFATSVTKDGQRVNFNVYPGLVQGEAPDYPFTGGGSFGAGTTDEDTDTGDGVTIMVHRLIQMGYLTREDGTPLVYDADVTAAIEDLQDDAGLSETGNMNTNTWRALYDLDATGYSLDGATTLPAAQRSYTRMWFREASGALSERNPNYDEHRVISDANIDLGPGFTPQQTRRYARSELGTEGHWSGTLPCHIALIRGEHNPGDPFTEADIMPAREVKPGMNGWAPLFGGTEESPGTLFHVSGVSVPEGGRDPELTLDTKARDTMKAWEVIQRNRDSRRSPARIWLNQYRSSTTSKDALGTWDPRLGGRIDKTPLAGGQWTVFPMVAGQAGTVRSIRIRTVGATRFCVAVFGRQVSAARLNHMQPAPLTEAGTAKWDKLYVRNWLESRVHLYTAGGFEQRGGYWPGQEIGNDGEPTGDPITGKHYEDAGFGFHTFAQPVLWVAVWAEGSCHIPAGRIMWLQDEAGS